MKFEYFAGEQRTEPWFELKLGKPSASNLGRWMAVSKRDGTTPLKARLDYEKELMFERTFKVPFEKFYSSAMQDGVDLEEFGRQEYAKLRKVEVVPMGAFHNEFFVASPDGGVGDEGLLELKWLKDTNWTEVLASQKPFANSTGTTDHWKQCQGQLFASGRKWCDYAAANMNTKKIIVLRILPDLEFFKELEASLKVPLSVEPFSTANVFDLVDAIPENIAFAIAQSSSDNNSGGEQLAW